jgi:hypothetical protein
MAIEVKQHQLYGLAAHPSWNFSLATSNYPPDDKLIPGEAATIESLQVPPVDPTDARNQSGALRFELYTPALSVNHSRSRASDYRGTSP